MAVVPVPDPLEAEGLVLRHVRLCDLDVLHEAVIRNREYLRPWVGQWILREPVSREARRHQIEEWIQEYPTGRGRNIIAENGEFRGMAGLHDRNGPRDVEVGYWVDEIHQGRGVATRATRALTRLALAHPDVDRVVLRHLVDNQPSRRIPEKLGFTLVDPAEEYDGQLFALWEMRATPSSETVGARH